MADPGDDPLAREAAADEAGVVGRHHQPGDVGLDAAEVEPDRQGDAGEPVAGEEDGAAGQQRDNGAESLKHDERSCGSLIPFMPEPPIADPRVCDILARGRDGVLRLPLSRDAGEGLYRGGVQPAGTRAGSICARSHSTSTTAEKSRPP